MRADLQTVLLVEDDPAQSIAVELMLQDYGFPTVLIAPDAESAWIILQQQPIDLLVCDLSLPGKDGVSLLMDMSQLPSHPAVIVLSSVDDGLLGAVKRVAVDRGLKLLGAVAKPLTSVMLDNLLKLPAADADSPFPVATSTFVPDDELLLALQQHRFEPFYEARINRATGRLEGVELLARLRLRNGGIVEPADFIERLEAIGKIDEMTWQIAAQGFARVRLCRDRGVPLNASINLSPSMLGRSDLIDRLDTLVREHGLDYPAVTLEITESDAIDSTADVLQRLVHLRLRGFCLSIDDFGTGFSSLMQLSKVPFTEMKIDREFTHAALADTKSKAVIESSIDLARRLGLKVCAEGVDTEEVFQLMADLGVDALQGYFFSRPMPGSALEAWATAWNRRPIGA